MYSKNWKLLLNFAEKQMNTVLYDDEKCGLSISIWFSMLDVFLLRMWLPICWLTRKYDGSRIPLKVAVILLKQKFFFVQMNGKSFSSINR